MSAGTGRDDGTANASKTSDLWVRTFSAIVLMPPAIVITYVGGIFFAVGVALLGYLLVMEWCGITSDRESRVFDRAFGVGLVLALLAAGTGYWIAAVAILIAIVAFAIGARLTGRATNWLVAGVLYSGLACFALLLLRQGETGMQATLLLVTIVWSTDIAAYFVGRTVGGPKLWPAVSPKKTWSGSIGGLVIGASAGVGLVALFGGLVDIRIGIIAIVLSLATQIGDLAESAFKRFFSVKDSGTLIPGHGGVLDRLDGLLLAAIAAILIGVFESGPATTSVGLMVGY